MAMEWTNLNELVIESRDYNELNEVKEFLKRQGLSFDSNIEYTVALFDGDKMAATGSFGGRILKCIAVDDDYKGLGISNKIISGLVSEEYRRGNSHLFIYTKPANSNIFENLGFYKIAEVPNKVALLENNSYGIRNFIEKIRNKKVNGEVVSSIVVNCNPFTLGHKYLIEKASRESDVVHVFVVSEDKSIFPSEVRYELVKEGLKHLDNVVLHKGEDYIISDATFPSYFLKKTEEATQTHTLLDIEIFTKYIAPSLKINRRYIGEEPLCEVTKTYNDTMKEILPYFGIEVIQVPRVTVGEDVVSASKVRRLIKENRFTEVKALVPDTTYKFLMSGKARAIINRM